MHILLWILQTLAVLAYGASGVMKTLLFDKISGDVPSFGALPRGVWTILGIVELACVAGLILPAVLHWRPALTAAAAAILALESLVFVWVHVKYGEVSPMIVSGVLGLLMAFLAYGRMYVQPLR